MAAVLLDVNWVVSNVDSNEIAGQEAVAKIKASFYRADIQDWASVTTAFNQTVHNHGRLDFVLTNARVTDPRIFCDSHSSAPSVTGFLLDGHQSRRLRQHCVSGPALLPRDQAGSVARRRGL